MWILGYSVLPLMTKKYVWVSGDKDRFHTCKKDLNFEVVRVTNKIKRTRYMGCKTRLVKES